MALNLYPSLALLSHWLCCCECETELVCIHFVSGAESVVYEAVLDGNKVAVKKPILSTSDHIDKFHKELQMRWSFLLSLSLSLSLYTVAHFVLFSTQIFSTFSHFLSLPYVNSKLANPLFVCIYMCVCVSLCK